MHVYKPPPVGGLDRVPVYTAGTGSTRATLFELDGVTPMPGNVLVADTSGNLPSFQCATSPVYVGTSGSRTTWQPNESGDPTPNAASNALQKIGQARIVTDFASAVAGVFTTLPLDAASIQDGSEPITGVVGEFTAWGLTVVAGTLVVPDAAGRVLGISVTVTVGFSDVANNGKVVGFVNSPYTPAQGRVDTVVVDQTAHFTVFYDDFIPPSFAQSDGSANYIPGQIRLPADLVGTTTINGSIQVRLAAGDPT